jgi:methionine-rich copper-binding protein CopC
MSILRTVALSGVLLSLSAAQAFAHAALVSSVPAASATVAPPAGIELHFSEGLVEKFSGAEVSSTRMMMGDKMMDHVIKIDGVTTALDPADKKAMIVTLKSPLAAGTYKLAWHAVAGDTHRSQGSYSFTVK